MSNHLRWNKLPGIRAWKNCFSRQNKKSGLRYEVYLNIRTVDIMWVNGPYTAGYYNDLNMFRDSLDSFLGSGKRVETDDGYIGDASHHIK